MEFGYKGKIAKLIQGAFWCKGISPNAFDEKYTKDTQNAVNKLRNDAGLKSGSMTVILMGALFDMSAFTIIGDGTDGVRGMQQYLNNHFLNYFGDDIGLVPTDGIYDRNTNTALIYALQSSEGMSPSTANGVYGPGTIARTPTVNQGATGLIVRIIQYGLLVNDFMFNRDVDDKFDSSIANSIIKFRKFMNLPPFTSTADLTVIKGLLTSNGNTNRDSDTADTATQLNSSDVSLLKRYGFSIIGRYLTGSVGAGSKKRDKNLTTDELETIKNGGMSVFPIYQDGGDDISYFKYNQGFKDALTASKTAKQLGFPKGTTIYFAVDTDIQSGDIDGTIKQYFEGISDAMSYYNIGVYGTRNVSTHMISSGLAKYCFVSDMSSGYSGNLGYPMSKNWSFDQFTEYSLSHLDIDQVASSGKDHGEKEFSTSGLTSPLNAVRFLLDNSSIQFNQPILEFDEAWINVKVSASETVQHVNSPGIFSIKNGKISSDFTGWFSKEYGLSASISGVVFDQLMKTMFLDKINNGQLTIQASLTSDGKVGVSATFNVFELRDKNISGSFAVNFDMTIKPFNIPTSILGSAVEVSEKVLQYFSSHKKEVATGLMESIVPLSGAVKEVSNMSVSLI